MITLEKKQQFLDKIISKLTLENLSVLKDSKAQQSLVNLISSSDQNEVAKLRQSLYNKLWRNPGTVVARLSDFGFLLTNDIAKEASVKFQINENFSKNLILSARNLSDPYWVDSSKKLIYLYGNKESAAALLCGSFDNFITNF